MSDYKVIKTADTSLCKVQVKSGCEYMHASDEPSANVESHFSFRNELHVSLSSLWSLLSCYRICASNGGQPDTIQGYLASCLHD